MKDVNQLRTIKFIGVVYGIIIMIIAFGVGHLDGVIESSMLLTSATSGPLLGVFLMALLIPCANWKVRISNCRNNFLQKIQNRQNEIYEIYVQGASIGVITGHLITLWITFGGLTIEKPPSKILPLTTDGCTNSSFNSHILKPEHRVPVWTVPTTTMSPYLNYSLTTRASPS